MSERTDSRELFALSAAEIFRSFRRELIPRHRRKIPPVVFLHRLVPGGDRVDVESFQLSPHPRETWARAIAHRVSETGAEWWAACAELHLKVEAGTPLELPQEAGRDSSWLVVLLSGASRQEAWWALLQRNERGQVTEIHAEQPIPPGTIRDQVLRMVMPLEPYHEPT